MDPTVTIIFPVDGDYGRGSTDFVRVREIAAHILGKSNLQFRGWTQHNLENRMRRLISEQAYIAAHLVSPSRRGDGRPSIYVGSHAWMSVPDFMAMTQRSGFPPVFLFLAVDDDVDREEIKNATRGNCNNMFLCWGTSKYAHVVVALACELSNWWGLKSLARDRVSFEHLAMCLTNLVAKINDLLSDRGAIHVVNEMRSTSDAWSGGRTRVSGVDYDHLTPETRDEQYSDAVKRLADASFAPRMRHLSPEANMISSHALFWLSELPAARADYNWFRTTRLAQELFGGDLVDQWPDVTLKSRATVPRNTASDFLQAFISIPPAIYPMGHADESTLSEPPAHPRSVPLAGYRILKRPVIGHDWIEFACDELPDLATDLPVVNCSASQAFRFAAIVEMHFRNHGLISPSSRVVLPNDEQWEAAARGPDGFVFPWGSRFEQGRCNCDLVLGAVRSPPGRFSPGGDSPFGCQDMAGNVREWTRSYGGVSGDEWRLLVVDGRTLTSTRDLVTLRPSDRLIVRGGSYSYDPDCVRAWVRNTQIAERRDRQTGFRLVIEEAES